MSRSMHLFLATKSGLEPLAQEISSLLRMNLQRCADAHETWYEYEDATTVLTLGTHDFENDREMNFEDYQYDIELRALNLGESEEREQRLADLVKFVYQTLKATQKYHLLLVDNLQVKLAEFSPQSRVALTTHT